MTETKVILRGPCEERDPLKPCVCSDRIPDLEIYMDFIEIKFAFVCPVCGAQSPPAYGLKWAKRAWNDGETAKIPENQKRIGDF